MNAGLPFRFILAAAFTLGFFPVQAAEPASPALQVRNIDNAHASWTANSGAYLVVRYDKGFDRSRLRAVLNGEDISGLFETEDKRLDRVDLPLRIGKNELLIVSAREGEAVQEQRFEIEYKSIDARIAGAKRKAMSEDEFRDLQNARKANRKSQ